jgi:hypothetical protein
MQDDALPSDDPGTVLDSYDRIPLGSIGDFCG